MKEFIKKVVIFSSLIIIFCFLLAEIKFTDDFISSQTYGTDYEKVGWNLNVINNRKEDVKNGVIFLGSSYVLNGVNDSILSLNGIKSLNLAIKHPSNDLALYFLKRLAPLKPKEIIFLKGKTFFGDLHKLSPLLYRPSELLNDGQSINLFFISYLFKRAKLSIEYLFYVLKNKKGKKDYDNKYGIRYEESYMSNHQFYAKEEIKKRQLEEESFNLNQNNFLYQSEKNNTNWLKRIKSLKRKLIFNYYSQNDLLNNTTSQENFVFTAKEKCKENDIIFSQIYLPVVSDAVSNLPKNEIPFMLLKSDADVIYFFKDYNFLNDNTLWTDKHHLSKNGSIFFTSKLKDKL
ncbi:MAG: hypothetical protein NWQ38_10760 [Cellulophaga sp.]|nr:hypothetical protein [Cellulophaga sp.]